jgi:hypothetical protein
MSRKETFHSIGAETDREGMGGEGPSIPFSPSQVYGISGNEYAPGSRSTMNKVPGSLDL